MKYSSGNCPQCGVQLPESSTDNVRRCDACGFVARKASFSIIGCVGNLLSLIGVSIFLLLCCGAVAIFIFAMNVNWSSPPIAEPAPAPTTETVPVETAQTPEVPPEPVPEPSAPTPAPTAQQPPPADQKQSTAAEIRTWTDKTGNFSTDASFGGMAGGVVTLHKTDGTTTKIPIDQLSPADQDWIAARRKNPVTKPRP
jgi:hypothetical protein